MADDDGVAPPPPPPAPPPLPEPAVVVVAEADLAAEPAVARPVVTVVAEDGAAPVDAVPVDAVPGVAVPVVALPVVASTLREVLAVGDVAGARALLGQSPSFPNVLDPESGTSVLANAIAVAPLGTIRELLRIGARPDNVSADLLPSLVATILSSRPDRIELLGLLLDAGTDVNQRGVNDWTPLHAAVVSDDPEAARLLVARGADVGARTGEDNHTTALEDADRWMRFRVAAAIRDALSSRDLAAGGGDGADGSRSTWGAPTVLRAADRSGCRVHPLCCGWLDCDAGSLLRGATGPMRIPVLAFLIQHPQGLVLFDTGLHPDLMRSVDRIGPLAAWFSPTLEAPNVVTAQLMSRGVDPRDVSVIVASHLHFDHCGGNGEIPNARIVLQRAEWDAAQDPRLVEAGTYQPADIGYGHDLQLLDDQLDVFGDGSIRVIPTPGHTPGHQSVMVDGRILLVGDACYCQSGLDGDILPPVAWHEETQRAGFGWLRQQQAAGALVLFSHDDAQYASLPMVL